MLLYFEHLNLYLRGQISRLEREHPFFLQLLKLHYQFHCLLFIHTKKHYPLNRRLSIMGKRLVGLLPDCD